MNDANKGIVSMGEQPEIEKINGDGESNCARERVANLFCLSWEDILFSHILPHLSWDDLFRLRSTSSVSKELVDGYFTQLKTIDMACVQPTFTGTAFEVVALHCTNLRKLVINRAKWITDKDLAVVFRNNHFLSFLDLSDCGCLNGSCLLSLAVNCKRLHTLILRHCNWVTHGALETIIAHLDSIEVADLTSCARMCNQILLPFIQKFQKLKELRIAHIQSVNDTTMLHIARSCVNSLKLLDVRGCQNITDRGIKMIAEYCGNLKTLHVSGATLVTEHSLRLLRARGVRIDREKDDAVPYLQPFYVQV